MRIAHVVTYVSTDGAFGGPVAVLRAQTAALAAAGHEVEVFAGWDGAAVLDIPGVRVRLFRARQVVPGTGFSGVTSPALLRALRAELGRFDAVHLHLGRHLLDLQAASTVRRHHQALVVQPHGMVMPSRAPKAIVTDAAATRRILRGADRVLALTADDERGLRCVARGPIRVLRVPNGIASASGLSSARTGSSVLFLARLHPRKRVLAFAQSAALVHTTHPDARFAVVGPDEGDLPALRAFIADHGLEDVLRYEGALPSGAGAARIAEADVFVLPAEREVFPMTVLEALSVGTSVVLARDCAIADELEQAGAAVVVDGSPESIADGVRGLLDDGERRRSVAEGGRALVETRLSIESVVTTLLTVYAEAGARRTGEAATISKPDSAGRDRGRGATSRDRVARADIVQVLLSPRIGGAESLAATLQAEWRRMGLQAETVYLDPEQGVRSAAARVRHLRAELRRVRPRALLAHSALPNVYARMVAPTGIAVCTVMHGGDDFADPKLRCAERVLRLRTTAVITVNEAQRQQYRARFGRRVPVERIPNAISSTMTPRAAPRPRPASAVTVARVVPQKQPEFWAAVAETAARELPGLRFDWWGPLGDEPEVGRAAARVEGVPSAELRGSTSEPERAYAEADLLFHPSHAEAQSIGLLEAAATGLPIVCSEPVGRTLDARLPRAQFADGDVADAIRALRSVLEDWDRVAHDALTAAPRVLADYSAAACASRYLAVLGLNEAPNA